MTPPLEKGQETIRYFIQIRHLVWRVIIRTDWQKRRTFERRVCYAVRLCDIKIVNLISCNVCVNIMHVVIICRSKWNEV